MSKLSNVYVLYTGGTIGMARNDPSNPASPLMPQPIEKLIQWVPGWSINNKNNKVTLNNGITLNFESFDEPLDSSNITPEDWQKIADYIERAYHNNDGFVVLHGTDTMAYTSSALSFIFKHLAKPVIITGSQLPLSDERTDGVMNLVNAVHIAGWKSTGLLCIPEVIVCFADRILRGCRTSKISSISWAGFDSPNYPHLGSIGEHIVINEDLIAPAPETDTFQVTKDINTNVLDIALNPGMKASQLKEIMSVPDISAIILRTFGAGNAPTKESFLKAIEAIIKENKTILNITQCTQGMVEMGLYEASSGLLERGVISGLDMTPEAALTKLYVFLANTTGDLLTTEMQINQRGEQTENLFDLRYGGCGNEDELKEKFDKYATADGRFHINKLTRAVVRLQGLKVESAKKDKDIFIRIFMNKPAATEVTSSDDPTCVAEFKLQPTKDKLNYVSTIPNIKAKSNMTSGNITLSVRSDKEVTFSFDGLYLALFSKSMY